MRLVGRGHRLADPASYLSHHAPSKTVGTTDSPDQTSRNTTRWEISGASLQAGWYMLEVEHSVLSIGCILTLESDSGACEHLLLTSKRLCKRIILFDARVQSYTLSIDQPECTLRRVEIVRLSNSFVMSRMRKRLESRGRVAGATDIDARALYRTYSSQMINLTSHGNYRPEPWATDCHMQEIPVGSAGQQDLQLLLHNAFDDGEIPLDDSVGLAVVYAQHKGWNVAWRDGPDLATSAEYRDKRVFHLTILGGVVFRQDALHQMMASIDDDAVLIYADHDHVDAHERYSDPVLKPAWNPELLLNANYIQLPWMISDSWICQLPGFPVYTSVDADQWLLAAALGVKQAMSTDSGRCNEDRVSQASEAYVQVAPLLDHQVKRVPLVLARVRLDQRPEREEYLIRAAENWRRKVRIALEHAGHAAVVTPGVHEDICQISWQLPSNAPLVDIIIPTRDKVDVLRACIESVFEKTDYPNYRLVVVDNDSEQSKTEAYYAELRNDSRFILLRYAGDFNYSAINNHAVANSDAPAIVLLNNDTEVISTDWLSELVRQTMRKEIGCVGAKLHYSNGRIQHGGVIVGITGVAGHAHRYCDRIARGYCNRLVSTQNMTAVTAACLAIRRSTYLEAGGLDHEKLGVAWNDVDFCLKVQRLGYRNLWTPYAQLYHHEGLSRGGDDTRQKIQRVDSERRVMLERWKLNSFDDPAYHPLLTRDSESFALGDALT